MRNPSQLPPAFTEQQQQQPPTRQQRQRQRQRGGSSSMPTPTPCCSKVGIKRGPWTAEEDEVLASFVRREGEGRWRTLPKRAGLLRCGKSCRLRWMNYLRPSIKRGPISADEEDLILRLHRLLGNRWSLISGRIPGRTDNEIKNYWNTHLSKKLIKQGIDPRTHKPFASVAKNPNSALATEAVVAAAGTKEEDGRLGYFDGLNLHYSGHGGGIKLGMDEGVVFSGFFDSFIDEDIIFMQQLHANNNSNNCSQALGVIDEKNKQVEVTNPPTNACLGFEGVNLWDTDPFAAYPVDLGEGFPGVYTDHETKY